MELYYASGLWLEPDDVLQPGSWGRVIMGARTAHSLFYRELMFEEARRRIAPERPSRLRCFFGVQTQDALARYQAEVPGVPHAYRVEVPDEQFGSAHHADLTVFHRLNQAQGLDETLATVEGYWLEPPGEYAEVLVAAPATVLERL